MNAREVLKRDLMARRPVCEGHMFDGGECGGSGLEMNEVLLTRGHARTSVQRKYITDKRNCALMCGKHHMQLGHTKRFRLWWRDMRARELYGADSVAAYLQNWPTKVRRG